LSAKDDKKEWHCYSNNMQHRPQGRELLGYHMPRAEIFRMLLDVRVKLSFGVGRELSAAIVLIEQFALLVFARVIGV